MRKSPGLLGRITATHKSHIHTVLTMQTASYELYKHPLQPAFWHYTRTGSPRAMQRAQHLRESAHGGHPQTITAAWEAKNLRMLWLPRLETGSLGASDGILAATRVDSSSFSGLPCAPFAHPAHTKKRIRKPPRTCQARNPDSGRGGDEISAPCWHSPLAKIRDLRRPQRTRAP